MKTAKIRICDTTREEREEIVRRSLGDSLGCEAEDGSDMYQDYIDGKREIAEINAACRTKYIRP